MSQQFKVFSVRHELQNFSVSLTTGTTDELCKCCTRLQEFRHSFFLVVLAVTLGESGWSRWDTCQRTRVEHHMRVTCSLVGGLREPPAPSPWSSNDGFRYHVPSVAIQGGVGCFPASGPSQHSCWQPSLATCRVPVDVLVCLVSAAHTPPPPKSTHVLWVPTGTHVCVLMARVS